MRLKFAQRIKCEAFYVFLAENKSQMNNGLRRWKILVKKQRLQTYKQFFDLIIDIPVAKVLRFSSYLLIILTAFQNFVE